MVGRLTQQKRSGDRARQIRRLSAFNTIELALFTLACDGASAENATRRKLLSVQGGCPGTPPSPTRRSGCGVVQMRWLSAFNTMEWALVIFSAGMMAASVLLTFELSR